MPIKFKADHSLALVIVHIEDELTAQELLGYFQCVHPDATINRYNRLFIIDPLSRVMSERETAAVALYARHSAGANTRHKTAIVASTDAAREVARQYQSHRRLNRAKLRIFNNLEKAVEWLELPHVPPMEGLQAVTALCDDYFVPMHRDTTTTPAGAHREEEETRRATTV